MAAEVEAEGVKTDDDPAAVSGCMGLSSALQPRSMLGGKRPGRGERDDEEAGATATESLSHSTLPSPHPLAAAILRERTEALRRGEEEGSQPSTGIKLQQCKAGQVTQVTSATDYG